MSLLRIHNASGYPLEYATDGAIGLDLRACLEPGNARYVQPGQRFRFDTGITIELAPGMGAFVQPRSGLGLHHGVVALTGVIDRDYRGRIGVVLVNHGSEPYLVQPGERIAQLVIVESPRVLVQEVESVNHLGDTSRGASGFGSTGR
jgi:dUTP pyrophosphatase